MAISDFPTNEIDPDINSAANADPAAQDEARALKLQMFGQGLAKKRDEWVKARRALGIDRQWKEDTDQYHGRDNTTGRVANMMDSVQQGYPVTNQGALPQRSTVRIGITRQKTNAAEARLSDILLPTDDRNWGIQPTPMADVTRMGRDASQASHPTTGQPMVGKDGQPVTKKQLAAEVHRICTEAAEGMQDAIDDQLNETDYNGELRKMIHDMAVLGTGVVKGPVVENHVRRAWSPHTDASGQTVHVIEIKEELVPASYRVDPRKVFPDPACGENVHDGEGVFEVEKKTTKLVRGLAKQPGYSATALRAVLEEGPKRSALMEDLDEQTKDVEDKLFEVWEYWGEVSPEDLKTVGVKDSMLNDDELVSVSACVIMINSTVVKAYLNPQENGDLPYDICPWEKVTGQVWGWGVPRLMKWQQSVINAAWRQLMDNAGVSSGPQIVIKNGMITPADGMMTVTPRKIWYANDEVADVRSAFTMVEVSSHQSELSAIIDMALKFVDDETGVPQLTQGEQGNAPDTVGGMQMLMNSANVVLRRLVKQFDDYITKPHIRRYYDYNMMYNDDSSIKGDFNVDARGSSTLLIRDIQNQAYMQMLALATNPVFAPMLNLKKLFENSLKAQHIDPTEIMLTDEEVEANAAKAQQQAAPQDPRIQAATIRAQSEAARNAADVQVAQAKAQGELEIAQQNQRMRLQELQAERELMILKLALQEKISIEQIKASLAETAIKERSRHELAAANSALQTAVQTGNHQGV